MEPEHDPLRAYEARGITWAKAMEHARQLARDASRLLRDDPTAKLVGIVMTPDCKEVSAKVAWMRSQGEEPADWVTMLVPRAEALRILRNNAPATLDWITPHSTGPDRRLPIVVGTPYGYKFGSEECEEMTFE